MKFPRIVRAEYVLDRIQECGPFGQRKEECPLATYEKNRFTGSDTVFVLVRFKHNEMGLPVVIEHFGPGR